MQLSRETLKRRMRSQVLDFAQTRALVVGGCFVGMIRWR